MINHRNAEKLFDKQHIMPYVQKTVWANSKFKVGMNSHVCFWLKMNFIAPNYNKHKKRCLVTIEMLKHYLTHDTLCPTSKKLFEKIQHLKLQCIRRCVFDCEWTSCLLITTSTKKHNFVHYVNLSLLAAPSIKIMWWKWIFVANPSYEINNQTLTRP